MKVLVLRGYSTSDYYFKGYDQLGNRLFTQNIEEAKQFESYFDFINLWESISREFCECKVFMDDVE